MIMVSGVGFLMGEALLDNLISICYILALPFHTKSSLSFSLGSEESRLIQPHQINIHSSLSSQILGF